MIEVRIHGRQGQDVTITAELLAIAASFEGRHAVVSPSPGTEGTDGEVMACCRIDDRTTDPQKPATEALIIHDPELLAHLPVLVGPRGDGYLLVNSGQRIDNLGVPALRADRAITVPATEIARKLTGQPSPSAALAGGFAALSGVVLLDSVLAAVRQWFGGATGKANAAAAMATFGIVRTELAEFTGVAR